MKMIIIQTIIIMELTPCSVERNDQLPHEHCTVSFYIFEAEKQPITLSYQVL